MLVIDTVYLKLVIRNEKNELNRSVARVFCASTLRGRSRREREPKEKWVRGERGWRLSIFPILFYVYDPSGATKIYFRDERGRGTQCNTKKKKIDIVQIKITLLNILEAGWEAPLIENTTFYTLPNDIHTYNHGPRGGIDTAITPTTPPPVAASSHRSDTPVHPSTP